MCSKKKPIRKQLTLPKGAMNLYTLLSKLVELERIIVREKQRKNDIQGEHRVYKNFVVRFGALAYAKEKLSDKALVEKHPRLMKTISNLVKKVEAE